MTIHIEDLHFKCIIGILDFERKKEQDVIINIELEYDFTGSYIDYAKLSDYIVKQMQEKKFHLIEDALDYFRDDLKENFKLIKTLYLKISKPSILPNARVSVSNSFQYNS